jgi:hypothetical protein
MLQTLTLREFQSDFEALQKGPLRDRLSIASRSCSPQLSIQTEFPSPSERV